MKFDEEKAKNLFLEAFGEISPADAVEVHNIWARGEYPQDEIFENGEDLLADWYMDQHWAELPPAFWEFCEYMDAAGDDEEGDENDDATEK